MLYEVQHNGKGPGHLLDDNHEPLCKAKGEFLFTSTYKIEVLNNKVLEHDYYGNINHVLAAPYTGYCFRCLKKAATLETIK